MAVSLYGYAKNRYSETYYLTPGFSSTKGCVGIDPNGGTITYGPSKTTTSTLWLQNMESESWNSSDAPYQVTINASISRTGYHISGYTSGSSNGSAWSGASWSGTTFTFQITSATSGTFITHIKVLWAKDTTTYTKVGAPGGVRVGTSTSYNSNSASNYNVKVPNGSFYVTWTAGSNGTNNNVVGYTRRIIRNSNSSVVSDSAKDINSTTTFYHLSNNWGSGSAGSVYKAQVKTRGSVSGYDSDWKTSTNTITFYESSVTYTACAAPTEVRVGNSTTHANNSTTYSTTAPNPGAFYITWNAGTAGNNNPIKGYRRKVQNRSISSSVWTADTNSSTRYSYSNNWNATAVGYTYDCTVMTLGSISGYDSSYSTAKGTVTFESSSSSGNNLIANPNGGNWSGSTSNRTYTNNAWTHQEIEPPTRTNYEIAGWYYDSTKTSYIDYGTERSVNYNIKITLWTDATTYNQGGSTSSPCSIFSCAQGGGYALTNENGNWEFQVHDGSGWKAAGVAASSVDPGYHEWCCIINKTSKWIRLYLDGTLKQQTSLTNSQISYGTDKKLLLGAELASGGGMYSNSGFVGKIGNFRLVYNTTEYTECEAPYYDQFDIPNESGKIIYAYWKQNGYTVTVNPNGGSWEGTTSNSTINVTYGFDRTLAVPTRAGYDFVGWASLNASFTNDYVDGTGFFSSLPMKYVYGTGVTNNSTLTIGDMDTISGFPSSAKMLTVAEPGTSARATGWYKVCQPAKNTEILVTVVAKIPRGTYLGVQNNANYQGTDYTWEYLTPMAGTGEWRTYAVKFNTGVINANSAVVGDTGFFVLAGNSQGINFSSTPNNATSYIAYQAIGRFDKYNGTEEYRPNTNATSDIITAIWIEKQYNISYILNGGNFNYDLNDIYHQGGSGATAEIGALNPESAYWNRSPYCLEGETVENNDRAKPNRSTYFEIENPTKESDISITDTSITTSFSAASSVSSIETVKSVVTQTPYNFTGWDITGMDGSTHYYWGKASGATINSGVSFTSTSITLTSSNMVPTVPDGSWGNGITQTIPYGFYNLRQSPGEVEFSANWATGTTTTETIYGVITLPTVPSKPTITTNDTKTIIFDANGGTCSITTTALTPYVSTYYTKDNKWYTTSSYTTSVGTQGQAYTPTVSGNLYAKYTTHTGAWQSDGIFLPNPTSNGRIFRGWYNGSSLVGFGGDYYLSTHSDPTTTTLTATWVDKYFVRIKVGNSWKKAIPYIFTNNEWKKSKAYINSSGWKPCGEEPDNDGYTHVVIVDTQSFSIPNETYDPNDDEGTFRLNTTTEFQSRITSLDDYRGFFSNCKRIRYIIDGNIASEQICDDFWKYDGSGTWTGNDVWFACPICSWGLYISSDSDCPPTTIWNSDWDDDYLGTTHTFKIEALM